MTRKDVDPIVRQIIDRDCHVSLSHRTVIRHVISKLRQGYGTFRGMPRTERRDLMRQCIAAHRRNVKLYQLVMRGSCSLRGKRLRRAKP